MNEFIIPNFNASVKPAMVAEQFSMRQIQVDVHQVAGLYPAQGYDIDRLEVEILCHYSNRRGPGGLLKTAYDI